MELKDDQIRAIKEVGNEWEKYGKHRVYFNDLLGRCGVEYSTYNTGNISNVEISGVDKNVSNNRGGSVVSALKSGKFYYDIQSDEFVCEISDVPYIDVENRIIDSIMNEIDVEEAA